jgi:MerR family transcriptional regulator, light-induced transcriptional regulator
MTNSMTDQLPTYNLRAVTHETGLSPETLRAWERRYGIVSPQRTPGGHRLYSLRDIKMLKWLVARQDQGLSISRAVKLWRTLEESGQDPLAASRPETPLPIEASNLEELRRAWVAACKEFDEGAAEQILSQAFAVAIPETVVVEILQKGVVEVGQLWYEGQASVQQEHFASALATRRLHALAAAAPPPSRSGRILAACPPGEEHEFALLLCTFLLKRQGWEVVYLGANVPLAKMKATLRATSPNLVLSLAQTLPAAASLREMAILIYEMDVQLAFGGAIFNQLPDLVNRIPGHFLGEEISKIPRIIDEITRNNQPTPPRQPISEEFQLILEDFEDNLHAIEAAVSQEMKDQPIPSSALDQANQAFPNHLKAALALGDVDSLDISIQWVEGLLVNYGMSQESLKHYLKVYQHAINERLEGRGALITQALQRYQENNHKE